MSLLYITVSNSRNIHISFELLIAVAGKNISRFLIITNMPDANIYTFVDKLAYLFDDLPSYRIVLTRDFNCMGVIENAVDDRFLYIQVQNSERCDTSGLLILPQRRSTASVVTHLVNFRIRPSY